MPDEDEDDIEYVCSRCQMPVTRQENGTVTHAEAANAVFCEIVYPRKDTRG